MLIKLYQSHHQIADFSSIFDFLRSSFSPEKLELHLFPEFFLCGHPLKDLCLCRDFIASYLKHLQRIHQWAQALPPLPGQALLGGPFYESFPPKGPPVIRNSLFELTPGKGICPIYHKRTLAKNDVFDEARYFRPSSNLRIWPFGERTFLLQICQDLWPSDDPKTDESSEKAISKALAKAPFPLGGVINFSSSPFDFQKGQERLQRAQEVSLKWKAPVIYCNRVGGEDEILFDGGSFVVMGEKTLWQGKLFAPDQWAFGFPLPPPKKISPPSKNELLFQAISFGIREYARKCGFRKILVALSGGADSSTLLALVKLSLGKEFSIEGLFMPGPYTSQESKELSQELCQNLSVPLRTFSITPFYENLLDQIQESFPENIRGTLADENIQSRLRGAILYTRSNQTNALVLNTSNRSELSVGYSTLYGDSVGALSPLGDLYKGEVYELAHDMNARYGTVIPPGILQRPPSAELRPHQKDSDTLPPYEELDEILKSLLDFSWKSPTGPWDDLPPEDSLSEKERAVRELIRRSEHKRSQFCPILKLRPKSFGFGHRMPLTAKL